MCFLASSKSHMARQHDHVRSIPMQEQHAPVEASEDVSRLYAARSWGAPAVSIAEKHNSPVPLLARVPIELIHVILRASAEDCGATNRAVVNSISRTCRLGYTIAIPLLYRVVVVNVPDYTTLYKCLFDEQSPFTEGVLCEPAVRRLCPLVQHLVLRTPDSLSPLTSDHTNWLTRLSSIFVDYPNPAVRLPTDILGPTRVHYSNRYPKVLPPSVTHVSFSPEFDVNGNILWHEFMFLQEGDNWSPTVTHVSLEFNQRIRMHEDFQLTNLLDCILNVPEIELIVLHLSGDALHPESLNMALISLCGVQDCNLVQLWADDRQFDSYGHGTVIDIMIADAYAGRTPWMEARALTDEELNEVREFPLGNSEDGEEDEDEDEDEDGDEDMADLV